MTGRFSPRRIVVSLAAPILALAFALVVTSLVLLVSGHPPVDAFQQMIDYGTQPSSLVSIVNRSTTYYLSAIAVAIGFQMKLFNIGVDGQYRLAAMIAASVGGAVALPPVLHVTVIVVTAALVGALWAGIAGVLRVTRGVSEVISTIMLNFIATAIVAYLLVPERWAILDNNNVRTPTIPASGQVPGFTTSGGVVFGFSLLAVAVGVAYWLVVNRTRFGFDLRATGQSESAAVASGVSVKRMIVVTMLLSGAAAGLVGMPQLVGASYSYSLDFPVGLGFTGIAIALLGRNHAVGIALAALLWSFLDQSAQILDLNNIPKEIVTIMQGTVVLSVVIAYEVVRRYSISREQQRVADQLAHDRHEEEAVTA